MKRRASSLTVPIMMGTLLKLPKEKREEIKGNTGTLQRRGRRKEENGGGLVRTSRQRRGKGEAK